MTQNLLENQQADQPLFDENKDYFEELVGDGKKFKTPQELAKAKFLADEYVKHKNSQFDELRGDYMRLKQDYDSRAKLEELIDQLSTTNQQLASSNREPQVNEAANKPVYDPSEVKSLVSNTILEFENSRKQQDNWNLVKGKLAERYGEDYTMTLKKQMDDLGMTEEYLNSTARSNPKLLIRALGLDQTPTPDTFQSPPRSNQRSDNFAPSGQKRTWSYYEKVRKEKPDVYWTPRMQDQLHKDHMSLGQAFEDGDFNR